MIIPNIKHKTCKNMFQTTNKWCILGTSNTSNFLPPVLAANRCSPPDWVPVSRRCATHGLLGPGQSAAAASHMGIPGKFQHSKHLQTKKRNVQKSYKRGVLSCSTGATPILIILIWLRSQFPFLTDYTDASGGSDQLATAGSSQLSTQMGCCVFSPRLSCLALWTCSKKRGVLDISAEDFYILIDFMDLLFFTFSQMIPRGIACGKISDQQTWWMLLGCC